MSTDAIAGETEPIPYRASPADPVLAAKAAGLRYANDAGPASGGRRPGRSAYLDAEGRPIRDEETLKRIKSLAIPPAWTDVWICPAPLGHIQATGRDAKGRKQYRYHPRWRAVRDETKYGRMIAFGQALPPIRARRRPRPARCPACRARRCWRPSSGCWRRR